MLVLLVATDEATAGAIGRGLEDRGHTVDLAPTSRLGLTQAALRAYDAVVVDPAVPGCDALDSAAGARRFPCYRSAPSPVGMAPASASGRGATPRALALDDLVTRLDQLRCGRPDRAWPVTPTVVGPCTSS
jgi:CheY-like chemotaxis protein